MQFPPDYFYIYKAVETQERGLKFCDVYYTLCSTDCVALCSTDCVALLMQICPKRKIGQKSPKQGLGLAFSLLGHTQHIRFGHT